MANQPPITPQRLRELLRYDPDTGKLFWLPRPRGMFTTRNAFATWNSRFVGKEALTALGWGYKTGCILNWSTAAHRVAWAHHYGRWATGEIDHLNGDRADNRICNLRETTRSGNNHNHGPDRRNKSGYTGVHWATREAAWQAVVRTQGRTKHLGFFSDVDEAGRVRAAAAKELGYSDRHNRRHAGRPLSS